MTTTSPVVTGVDFLTVIVDDFEKATEFYGTTLGLPCSARYGKIDGAEFETGDLCLQVISAKAINRKFEHSTHPLALRVDDVEATRSQLEERGVKFFGETIDSGVCHMAFFGDPSGNVLCLHHRYAPRD